MGVAGGVLDEGRAAAHRFAAEIPHARLEILEGAGHFVFEDEPERTAAAVASFLSGV